MVAPIVKIALARRGYQGAVGLLERTRRRPVSDRSEAVGMSRAAEAVMKRAPVTFTCLERSLVVWWLVGGDDASHIQFGVAAKEGSAPTFHAWVEMDGVPINDTTDVATRYLPLTTPVPPATGFD